MIFGYCRVSSKSQIDNNSLEQQKQEILKKYPNAVIYCEQYTATKVDRPVFNEVREKLRKGDTLAVTKLDRLARNTREGLDVLQQLFEQGIVVDIFNVGEVKNNPVGKLLLTMLLAIAEMERSLMLERTQAGKEIAKMNNPNYREGRPRKYNPEKIEQAIKFIEQGNSYSQAEKIYGISRATLHRKKKEKESKELRKEVDNHD